MLRTVTIAIAGLAVAAVPAAAQDVPAPAPAVPVTGNVIMDGTWERAAQRRRGGLPAQWLGMQAAPLGRKPCFALRCARYSLRLVKSPVRDGVRAARFELRDRDVPFGDAERVGVQGAVTGKAGNLRWYTWSTFLPRNFRHKGANDARFLRLVGWAGAKGSPPIGIYVYRNRLVLQVNVQDNPRRFRAALRPWGVPVKPLLGRWVDFAMFVKWSPRNDGQVQLWVDGVQQAMNWPFGGQGVNPLRYGGAGGTTFFGRTLVPRGGGTVVQQGIVRDRRLRGKTVVIHDALKVHAATGLPAPPAPPAEPAPAA